MAQVAKSAEISRHVISATSALVRIIRVAIIKTVPQLVLCDIALPIMSGFEVLERLNDLAPRLGHLPFIFLTALADRDNELRGRRLGADDYVRAFLCPGEFNGQRRRRRLLWLRPSRARPLYPSHRTCRGREDYSPIASGLMHRSNGIICCRSGAIRWTVRRGNRHVRTCPDRYGFGSTAPDQTQCLHLHTAPNLRKQAKKVQLSIGAARADSGQVRA
jgi:CheY-like chemotaxis protein